jgi:hypothetical protein
MISILVPFGKMGLFQIPKVADNAKMGTVVDCFVKRVLESDQVLK